MLLQKRMTNEIFSVTSKIQKDFPSLYEHLNETPLLICYNGKAVSVVDYQGYLESIQLHLSDLEESSQE